MNDFNTLKAGFIVKVEHVRRGVVIDTEIVKNMMPEQGRNHVLGVVLTGQPQILTWFFAPYTGNYTPQDSDTAASMPGAATEYTGYAEAARQAFVPGAIAAGSVDNSASIAIITSNQVTQQTIRGAFLASASTKSSASGILLSSVKFASPKLLDNGDILKFIGGFQLLNFA